MTKYSISRSCLTDTHFDPGNWSLTCTHHPAPVGGWYTTNNLKNAQCRPVALASIIANMLQVDDLSETEKKGKVTEHGKLHAGIFAPVTLSLIHI